MSMIESINAMKRAPNPKHKGTGINQTGKNTTERTKEKEARLQRIKQLFTKGHVLTISSLEAVEGVSNSTASKDLQDLVSEGFICFTVWMDKDKKKSTGNKLYSLA